MQNRKLLSLSPALKGIISTKERAKVEIAELSSHFSGIYRYSA